MAELDDPAAGPRTRVDHETDEPDGPDSSASEWLLRGQSIDRYIIIECLGVGGMGVIYSAWDPQLDRKLALKVVRDHRSRRSSARARARLLREAQALARLRHPNVVAVHDVGDHDDRVFVAMEFVEGETLQRWLLRSPRPPTSELVNVFLKVGRGLAAAHRVGIVHRDVKPENVMIGEDGRVLVLDFGIAREGYGSQNDVLPLDPDTDDDPLALARDAPPTAVEPELVEAGASVPDELEIDHTPLASLTRTGAVIGTPAYMSPEQHRGQTVDARSDQFSFCVAMWEALHGEKPFGEGGRQKLLARMRVAQLRRPHNREVPRFLNKALTRGLSWHPGERFETTEALLEALNPRAATAAQRLWHGLGIGALGGMTLGVAMTLLSVGARVGQTTTKDRGSSLRPVAAIADAAPAPGGRIPAELRRELGRLEDGAARGLRGVELAAIERLSVAAREARDHRALARALVLEARWLAELGRSAEAGARALEAASAAASAADAQIEARALLIAAAALADDLPPSSEARGREAEARRWLDHAAALVARLATDDPLRVELLVTEARVDRAAGHPHRARQALREARVLLGEHDDPRGRSPARTDQLAAVIHDLGRVNLDLDLAQRAADHFHEAARLADERADASAIELDLGRALDQLDQPEAARDAYERALALALARGGPGPASARARTQLGALEAAAERCDHAWPRLSQAIADARLAPSQPPVLAEALETLALACASSHPQALDFAREALEIRQRLHRPQDPRVDRARAAEALALLALGEAEAARSMLERAPFDPTGGRQRLASAPLWFLARGLVLAELGEPHAARAELQRATATLDDRSVEHTRASAALEALDR